MRGLETRHTRHDNPISVADIAGLSMEFTCLCILTEYALDLSEFSFVSLMYNSCSCQL